MKIIASLFWFALNAVSVITVLITAAFFVLIATLIGKRMETADEAEKPDKNMPDIENWPRWLHIGKHRILPIYVFDCALVLGCIFSPHRTEKIAEWLIVAVLGSIILWVITYCLHKWTDVIGHPLVMSAEYDSEDCGCACGH